MKGICAMENLLFFVTTLLAVTLSGELCFFVFPLTVALNVYFNLGILKIKWRYSSFLL